MLTTKQARHIVQRVLGVTWLQTWTNGAEKTWRGGRREIAYVITNTEAARLEYIRAILWLAGHTGKTRVFNLDGERRYLRITQLELG